MGFYIRKSLRAGPLRFNLSKSGIGVSAGIPGFRVGTGPRGNYVHLGRGGVYYRASLGGGARTRGGSPASPSGASWSPPPESAVPMEDVTGASVIDLAPSGRGDLVEQLNEAASRARLGRWAFAAAFIVLFIKPPVGTLVALAATPAIIWLILRDRTRRAVVAFYDVNDEAATWFQHVVDAAEAARGMSRRWRINTAGNVRTTYQYKVNSGASTIVSRSDLSIDVKGPKHLRTNIVVPTLRAGRNALHFLPDRLLVTDGKRYSDVAYTDVIATAIDSRFIESSSRPRDATQIDTTWQFVNVRGGPDRRYKNNRQFPVMVYNELSLTTAGGLNWLVQGSKKQGFAELARVLRSAPRSLEREHAESAPASAGEPPPSLMAPTGAFSKSSPYSEDSDSLEGADEVTPISAETLPPRVPRSADERDALLETRPAAWEYLLFSSCLLAGKEALEAQWRDTRLGLATGRKRKVSLGEATDRLQAAMNSAQDSVARIMSLLAPAALEPAFGRSGEAGDPQLIEHLASRFVEVYRNLLDWPSQLRDLDAPAAIRPALDTASHFVDRPIEQIRDFIQTNVDALDSLAERMRGGGPIELVFNLTLEMDESLVEKFEAQLEQAQSLR